MAWQSETRLWLLTATALFALTGVGWRVWTAPPIPDLAPVVKHADATLKGLDGVVGAIDAPCVGFHGAETCGVLAQAAQTEKNIGIVAGRTAEQVQQSGQLVDAASQSLATVAAAAQTDLTTLNEQERQLGPLLAAGTGVLTDTRTSLSLLNSQTIPGVDRGVADFDALLQRNAVHLDSTLANVDGITTSAVGIGNDLYSFEHRVLDPPPCRTRRCSLMRAVKDVPPILGVGTGAMDLYNAFRGYPVDVRSLP